MQSHSVFNNSLAQAAAVVVEPAECWAEFSLDSHSSKEITDICESLVRDTNGLVKAPSGQGHHVTLLYGYKASESPALMECVRKHFDKPFTLIGLNIQFGDVNPVILLHVTIPQELKDLFWEAYNNLGTKKHTLINKQYYPHITVASFDEKDKASIQPKLEALKEKLKGKEFKIETILSLMEDPADLSRNLELDKHSQSSQPRARFA